MKRAAELARAHCLHHRLCQGNMQLGGKEQHMPTPVQYTADCISASQQEVPCSFYQTILDYSSHRELNKCNTQWEQ